MNENLELADRLRTALHDLDARTHTLVADHPRAADRPARFLLVPALAGLAVTALVISVIGLTSSDSVRVTPSRPDRGPSQSAADAARDLVLPDIAALPLSVRLAPVEPRHPGARTELTTPDGVWVISSPDISSITGHCPNPPPTIYPDGARTQRGTCIEYTEILLMTPDLRHIERAWPIADNPAQWLTLTPDAVYCGRQDLVRSMICRIDRSTQALVGRTFPATKPVYPKDLGNSLLSQDFPGTWTKQKPTSASGFDQADLTADGLQISSYRGAPTVRLDPLTLAPRN